jgi:hypothetical protein
MSARRLRLVALLGAAGVICLVSLAGAEDVTRDSYREAVEPLCKQNAEANARIFKGVRAMVRRQRLRPAAARFDAAAKALKQTVAQLRSVPPPPADEVRVAKWLGEVSEEAVLFQRTASTLRSGGVRAAYRMVSRLGHQAVVANAVMVPFNFDYCQLEPSRFT